MNEEARRRVVAALLSGTAAVADGPGEEAKEHARKLARSDWGLRRVAALKRAQTKADAAWMRLVAPYEGWDDADLPELGPPPEQAAVDAIHAELNAALEEDRWPRHLHWSV